jgi:hypothetical protein
LTPDNFYTDRKTLKIANSFQITTKKIKNLNKNITDE